MTKIDRMLNFLLDFLMFRPKRLKESCNILCLAKAPGGAKGYKFFSLVVANIHFSRSALHENW